MESIIITAMKTRKIIIQQRFCMSIAVYVKQMTSTKDTTAAAAPAKAFPLFPATAK